MDTTDMADAMFKSDYNKTHLSLGYYACLRLSKEVFTAGGHSARWEEE